MNNLGYIVTFRTTFTTALLAAIALTGAVAQVNAQGPSFTFSATVPTQVVAGQSFNVPASITDVGDPATNYHSFFQVYDSGFTYISQSYYDNQSFAAGQTLDYNVSLTAPTTPGYYWLAGLMFNQDYTGGIVDQQFFLPQFQVVDAPAVPEPGAGVYTGVILLLMLVGAAKVRSRVAILDAEK
jgi:hypothetical protein